MRKRQQRSIDKVSVERGETSANTTASCPRKNLLKMYNYCSRSRSRTEILTRSRQGGGATLPIGAVIGNIGQNTPHSSKTEKLKNLIFKK